MCGAMSVFRQIALALLLIALLPWGAFVGRSAIPVADIATWTTRAETVVRPGADQAMQKPWVKCRQGLPGFQCSTDQGTLVKVSDGHLDTPRSGTSAPRAILLPQGQSPGPRLRPPISA